MKSEPFALVVEGGAATSAPFALQVNDGVAAGPVVSMDVYADRVIVYTDLPVEAHGTTA